VPEINPGGESGEGTSTFISPKENDSLVPPLLWGEEENQVRERVYLNTGLVMKKLRKKMAKAYITEEICFALPLKILTRMFPFFYKSSKG